MTSSPNSMTQTDNILITSSWTVMNRGSRAGVGCGPSSEPRIKSNRWVVMRICTKTLSSLSTTKTNNISITSCQIVTNRGPESKCRTWGLLLSQESSWTDERLWGYIPKHHPPSTSWAPTITPWVFLQIGWSCDWKGTFWSVEGGSGYEMTNKNWGSGCRQSSKVLLIIGFKVWI